MGIDFNKAWFEIYLDQWVILGVEEKPTKLGIRGLAPPFDEDGSVWDIEYDGCFVNHHTAVVVA